MQKPSPRLLLSAALVLSLAPGARAVPAGARERSTGPGPLALERVFADVDAANPSVAVGRHESTAAWARARRAGAWDAPMLELAAENVPVTGGFDMDPMTMKVVGLEQKLDLFGTRALARRAAEGDARATQAEVDDTRWQRFGEAWTAFADAYFAGARAVAARDHQQVMDKMVSAARARYESGRGRLDDLLRVEAERARIVGDAVTFAAEAAAAQARLDALRGREPGGRPPEAGPETLAAPPESLAPDSAAGWRDAVAAHPGVRALGEREAGRRGMARAARRMAWPELTLRASYGFREPLAPGVSMPGVPNDDMWSAGVSLDLPLGVGSRQGAEAAEALAMADAAHAERRAMTLDLESEIAALRARATAARRTIALITDTVLVAQRRALAASWSAYETGATDLAGVLDAAHASYAEELEASRARQDLAGMLARLLSVTARPELVGVHVPAANVDRRKP
jgi:outer membrane protein TolC